MLQINPIDRPDIKTILSHPYFNQDISGPCDMLNPFTHPFGVSESEDSSWYKKFYTESAFGWENIPSFGSSENFDSDYRIDVQMSGFSNSPQKYKNKTKLSDIDNYPDEIKYGESPEKKMMTNQSKQNFLIC